MTRHAIDITGQRHGHLTATGLATWRTTGGAAVWHWRCDCGRSITSSRHSNMARACGPCRRAKRVATLPRPPPVRDRYRKDYEAKPASDVHLGLLPQIAESEKTGRVCIPLCVMCPATNPRPARSFLGAVCEEHEG